MLQLAEKRQIQKAGKTEENWRKKEKVCYTSCLLQTRFYQFCRAVEYLFQTSHSIYLLL